jgi:geranylgeranyl diphosphate synthase type I
MTGQMANKSIAKISTDIEDALRTYIEDLRQKHRLDKLSPFVFKHLKEFSLRGGKRLRPLFFTLSYRGYAKKTAPHHLTSAAGLELIQAFILIHDDIVDRSETRRGAPTLHRLINDEIRGLKAKFNGSDAAMVIGDIIFALGIQAFMAIKEKSAMKEKALNVLLGSALQTGCGEINELMLGLKDLSGVTKEDIFRIYDQKTGSYTFVSPLIMGAILAGADISEIGKLSECGTALGRAFQVKDDIEDSFDGEMTIPVWLAYRDSKPAVRREMDALMNRKNAGKSDQRRMDRILLDSRAKEKALNEIFNLVDKAKAIIRRLRINETSRGLMLDMIDELFGRRGEIS